MAARDPLDRLFDRTIFDWKIRGAGASIKIIGRRANGAPVALTGIREIRNGPAGNLWALADNGVPLFHLSTLPCPAKEAA